MRIVHPPTVGLTVKRLAFGPATGTCADEFLDRKVLPDFRQNHVDVIERQHLDQIIAEHALSRGAEGRPQDEVALGRILGPSVLIFIKTYDCRTDKQPLVDNQKDYRGYIHTTYISRTRVVLSGSIESVDLTTGQVLGSNSFKGEAQKENTNDTGPPEFPSDDEVKEEAMSAALMEAHRVFFPWGGTEPLVFYDDKDCGLKEEYELYNRGDHEGAMKLADANLEQCKSNHKNDKVLARSFYDAALTHLLTGDYDKAVDLLGQSMQLKGADAAAKALNACREAQGAQQGMKTYLAKIAQIPEPAPIAPPSQSAQATAPPAPVPSASSVTPPSPPASDTTSKLTPEQRLKNLDRLLKQGLITQKEYAAKKAAILSEL